MFTGLPAMSPVHFFSPYLLLAVFRVSVPSLAFLVSQCSSCFRAVPSYALSFSALVPFVLRLAVPRALSAAVRAARRASLSWFSKNLTRLACKNGKPFIPDIKFLP